MFKEQSKRSLIGLMGTLLVNDILYMFLNTFMIAYFIKLSNYNYRVISVYYIYMFISILFTTLLLGRIVKNKSQLGIYRTGIIFYCIYILLVALLKEKILIYYIPLGIFYGMVQGFFWSAGHTLMNEYAWEKSDKFVSVKSIIDKLLKIFFPIIFGVSIELTSFSYIAKVVISLSVIQFIFSLFIKNEKLTHGKKYNLKHFIKKIKINDLLKKFYKLNSCEGIVGYLLDTIITIVIVMTFKTTISLGFLTTLISISSILSVYLYQNKIKNKNKAIKVSSIVMFLCITILIFKINKLTIIIYNLCTGLFFILLRNAQSARRYSILNKYKSEFKDYIVEHQVFSEVIMNVTRIIGYLVLFVASLYANMIMFKILLFICAIIMIMYANLINKTNVK